MVGRKTNQKLHSDKSDHEKIKGYLSYRPSILAGMIVWPAITLMSNIHLAGMISEEFGIYHTGQLV